MGRADLKGSSSRTEHTVRLGDPQRRWLELEGLLRRTLVLHLATRGDTPRTPRLNKCNADRGTSGTGGG